MGGGMPISGWKHSADLTIHLAPIHGALTPMFVKSPLYLRRGGGHDTDRYISAKSAFHKKLTVLLQRL